VSQIEPMVHVIADLFAEPGIVEKPGNDHPRFAPHGVFPCRGEENWIAIAVQSDAQWRALCTALDLPSSVPSARENAAPRSTIDAALADATRTFDKFELAARLAEAGVPAAPVLDGKEVFENTELNAAGHFVRCDHPVLGTSMMPAPPMHFSGTPGRVRRAPLLGEHTEEVFTKLLGHEDGAVERLRRDEVLA